MADPILPLPSTSALGSRSGMHVPTLVADAGDQATLRFLEFFAGRIRNPHTRRAYARAVGDFLAWCADTGVPDLTQVQPLHVAAWVEGLGCTHAAPTVKQRLAAVRGMRVAAEQKT